VYDLKLDTEQPLVVTTSLSDVTPDISGDLVVWDQYSTGGGNIQIRSITTGDTFSITKDSAIQENPVISGNIIVWEDLRNDTDGFCNAGNCNKDIYYCVYDPSTGDCPNQQITSDPGEQRNPAVSGNRIVWQDFRNDADGVCDMSNVKTECNWDIYYCDINPSTDACPIQSISNNQSIQRNPSISENSIVWEDWRYGNSDIYIYDVLSSTEQAVTNHPGMQYDPDIDNDQVVWHDDRNGVSNYDVYYVDLDTTLLPDLIPTTILYDATLLDEGNTIIFDSGIRNDGQGDSPPFNVRWLVDGADLNPPAYGGHKVVFAQTTELNDNSFLSWTATPGTHTITFRVDVDDQVVESDETNNETSITVDIIAPASPIIWTDLVGVSVSGNTITKTAGMDGVTPARHP